MSGKYISSVGKIAEINQDAEQLFLKREIKKKKTLEGSEMSLDAL